jgi:hypothetical protein
VVADNLACNSLIGRINGGTPFEVGSSFNSTAPTSGELDLGVNDSYFADNTQGWTATINLQNSCPPSTINETEGSFTGVWSWDGSGYSAKWSNGAVATIEIKNFTAASVVLDRTDTSTSVSAGLTAVYTGQIASDGKSIVNGSVTWTWPGVAGYPTTGTWNASWANSCSAPTGGTIASETFATVPDHDNKVRTKLGVGEQVWLRADPPQTADWSITSTSGLARLAGATAEDVDRDPRFEEPNKHFRIERELPTTECEQNDLATSQSGSGTVCLSAPYDDDQITVKATFSDGSSALKKFTVTKPTGMIMQRLEFPKETADSDYLFEIRGGGYRRRLYRFAFSPAVFITPGDVSFAYAGIGERDPGHFPGQYSPPYNLLFDLNGTKAWLTTCDKVISPPAVTHSDSFSFPWIFSPFNREVETPFTSTQTGWMVHADNIEAWKGQLPISNSNAAVLNTGYEEFDDWREPRSSRECQEQLVRQFTCASSVSLCNKF